MLDIRLATISDIPPLREHLIRHSGESGKNGDIIFAPYEESYPESEESLLASKKTKWAKPVTELGWERCWIIADENGIYGELKLTQQLPLKTALHRATLMMGIERSHRNQGLGTQLFATALAWIKEQPSLEWIDLYVFAHNEAAIALYSKIGFKEVGRVTDLFRVREQKIDDIHMTLRL